MPRHSTTPADEFVIAYSYIRFSHPDQAKGDSLRRQTEAAAEWCKRHKVNLDTSLTLHDLGKSAYTGKHRENPDRHALAAFLKLVETGKVLRGSYLILENLDRLSREHIQPALLLGLNLLQAGVRIVQLKPVEMIFDDKSDTLPVMMMMMELSRGHGESAIKSERIGKAWQEKKRRARNGEAQEATRRMGKNCYVMTHRLPAWIEERDGQLHVIPKRAAAGKRIFELAIAGYGQLLIIKKLNEEGVAPFGSSWNRATVNRILNDRRALGEFQPRKGKTGEADGEAIKGYFPAIVTEEEWLSARAGQQQRFKHRGRPGHYVNAFAGMLFNARAGDAYYCRTAPTGGNRSAKRMQRVLVNYDHIEGRAPMVSFPFPTFERAILKHLREIKAKDILEGTNGHNEVMALEGEETELRSDIAKISADLDAHGESPTQYARLRAREARLGEVTKLLAEARQKAANPLSSAWGEMQSLLEVIDSAPDPNDARTRLRTLVRRVVGSIWLLVVPRGRDRLAAVQLWFSGGEKHREYLILHQPPIANASARTDGVRVSGSLDIIAEPFDLDLHRRDHAAKLETILMKLDTNSLKKLPAV
ncbi:MAG TPA: recombinase family protein [Gemmataceae bacterium]|jgi:DNA invertase Pin-like site-specific DNA recombinase